MIKSQNSKKNIKYFISHNITICVISVFLFFIIINKLFAQIDGIYLEANKSFLSNNFEKAEGLFTQIIKSKPDYKDVYYKRGMCYLMTNQLDLAEEDFTRAIDYNSKNADAFNARGLVFENMGDTQKALEDYSKAIKINNKFAEAYINRGNMYNRLSDFEKSIGDLNTAISLDNTNPAAYYRRGKVQYSMKWFDKAILDFNTAIAKGLKNSEIYYDRGNVYFRKKDHKNAIKDYTEALKINSKNLEALNNRAMAYESSGDKVKAQEDRDQIAKITGVKFVPKDKLKYRTYTTNRGDISITLPEGWYAFESGDKDEWRFNISMKNDRNMNPGVPNVIMALNKNMKKRYNVYAAQEILGFWQGSIEKNSVDYEQYDVLTKKSYTQNGKSAQLNETMIQITPNSNLLFSYEMGIVDTDKFFYAYLQCPNRQMEYMQDVFLKAIKSINVKF